MVHFKIIISLTLLSFFACNITARKSYDTKQNNDFFTCFQKITDSLKFQNDSITFIQVDKKENAVKKIIDMKKRTLYEQKINEQLSFVSDEKIYVFQTSIYNFILIIGKAIGSTNYLYWDYYGLSLDDININFEFASIINSPYSFSLKNNDLLFLELDDNSPDPADGKVSIFHYSPVKVFIYSVICNKVIHEFDFMCEW